MLQRLERLLDHGVGRLAPQLGDQRDPAAVVLVAAVVEAYGPGSDGAVHMAVPRGLVGQGSGTAALLPDKFYSAGAKGPKTARSSLGSASVSSWPTGCASPPSS